MVHGVIPLTDVRALLAASRRSLTGFEPFDGALPRDLFGRPLRDLRISVTDRCNFRCSYCMPKEVFGKTHAFLPQSALLSFEEIERLAATFVALGVQKIRLTGGEPLLRRHLELLIARLAALRTPAGQALDLTLTTNGSVLASKAQALKDAGLQRVTVSLDALDDAIFRRLNDVDFPVADVLAGIDAAVRVGLGPIKVNMVVKRGVNDSQILPMVRHFKGTPVTLRFIEFMDVGATNGWLREDVLPSAEIVARIAAEYPLERLPPNAPGETAQRWRFLDASGDTTSNGGSEIGFISSVSNAFCGDCNRARLSTEGKLYSCLFATHGHDLRALLRGGADDVVLRAAVSQFWRARSDRYSELRGDRSLERSPESAPAAGERRVEMHYIGG